MEIFLNFSGTRNTFLSCLRTSFTLLEYSFSHFNIKKEQGNNSLTHNVTNISINPSSSSFPFSSSIKLFSKIEKMSISPLVVFT
jgi:hypothetical protein